jgi:hypothetical protein
MGLAERKEKSAPVAGGGSRRLSLLGAPAFQDRVCGGYMCSSSQAWTSSRWWVAE